MTTFLLYTLAATALYYLGSWALVTRWLWSRYPARVASFMACAACSGFWYGVAIGVVGGYGLDLSLLGLASDAWTTPIAAGLCALVTTPIVARVMLEALERLGGDDAQAPEPERPVLDGGARVRAQADLGRAGPDQW